MRMASRCMCSSMGVTSMAARARGLPSRISSPYRRVNSATSQITSLMPMASTTIRAPLPSVHVITASFRSSRLEFTVASMPHSCPFCKRRSDRSATITSAPAIRKSCAAKLPTSPMPIMRTVSPGCTLEARTAPILTPAMRAKTSCLPSAPDGAGRAMRAASALRSEACWEKLNTRSPGLHMLTASPTAST